MTSLPRVTITLPVSVTVLVGMSKCRSRRSRSDPSASPGRRRSPRSAEFAAGRRGRAGPPSLRARRPVRPWRPPRRRRPGFAAQFGVALGDVDVAGEDRRLSLSRTTSEWPDLHRLVAILRESLQGVGRSLVCAGCCACARPRPRPGWRPPQRRPARARAPPESMAHRAAPMPSRPPCAAGGPLLTAPPACIGLRWDCGSASARSSLRSEADQVARIGHIQAIALICLAATAPRPVCRRHVAGMGIDHASLRKACSPLDDFSTTSCATTSPRSSYRRCRRAP